MTTKLYRIIVRGPEGDRTIRVPSPTDAQAADAAAPLMGEGDTIQSIDEEVDPDQVADGGPPNTQAEELAPATSGAAAVHDVDAARAANTRPVPASSKQAPTPLTEERKRSLDLKMEKEARHQAGVGRTVLGSGS